jgi:ATP/maltotriose-dependent transcriptional regulator MalT/DNA-binding SARP family transcriptional activator
MSRIVLQTKLYPPRPQRHTLVRPRISALLQQARDFRVTVVRAGTGYGKSTALADLNGSVPLFWYSANESDSDPQQFLAHLVSAFRVVRPELSDAPLGLLESDATLLTALDALLNGLATVITAPSILVLDDYHLAASPRVDALVDHFLSYLPRDLSVIVSTRHAPEWEHLVSWRARGQALELDRTALAFTREEIAMLFQEKFQFDLSPTQLDMISDKTEGWPIALQLIRQELRANPERDLRSLFARGGDGEGELDTLFAYLAHDVLAQQPKDIRAFLIETAVLRELTPDACAAVSDPERRVRELLDQLGGRDLFLIALGQDHYRYHHLFHDFLREQSTREDKAAIRERHRRAAQFYQSAHNDDEAVYHWLAAQDYEQAALTMERAGEELLRLGRLETLAAWIDALPPDTLSRHPLLIFDLGDLARLQSRFDDALAFYAQAERSWRASNDVQGVARALRGEALVYLDTVRPARAEDLLEEALRLTDGLDDREAKARLLELLAENKLNTGRAKEAEELREQARNLREEGPSEDALSVRVKLRTGRLDEARGILENWAQAESGQLHPPRAHRETLLILSLINSMQGEADRALMRAQEGLALGERFHSPFVSAVGQMRLGHAYQVRGDLREALSAYERAVALGEQVAVARTRVEARWGMTRALGLLGDLDSARAAATDGVALGRQSGDAWVVALVQLALGASLVLARREREGVESLTEALAAFRASGDTFGRAATRLWLALAFWQSNQRERAIGHLEEALDLAQLHHYDYLLTRRTLCGLQDPAAGVPLLLYARRRGQHAAFVGRLLEEMNLAQVSHHAGYALRVQTFGAFRVWRGTEPVEPREWQRKTARQLLELFVTRRGRMLEREEIFELLWNDESPANARRDFQVALNALNKVLEPNRAADDEPAFIARQDSAYGLRADAQIRIDADEFTMMLSCAEKESSEKALVLYRSALELYQDDYLIHDARYDDWAIAERERLLTLYLRAADRLATRLLEGGEVDECLIWCDKILARDECWEHVYRLMMRAYAQRGDLAQIRRVFDQCARVMNDDLDADPSPATVQIFRELTGPRA